MMESLLKALVDGDQDLAVAEAKQLLSMGVRRQHIIVDAVEKSMGRLDVKCTVEAFNLLEIMLCGRAVMGVIRELYPKDDTPRHTKGTVVIGTLEGDVHDLGKNILKIVLVARGYKVIDCGRDCSAKRLIDNAEQEGALAVGISGLITTVVPQARRIRPMVEKRGLKNIKIMAGGGALKQASAESLNVDFVAQTSFDGLHYLDRLVENRR